MDEAITAFIRRKYGTLIGDATAERIKHTIGSAQKVTDEVEIDVRGRHLAEGVPKQFFVDQRNCGCLQNRLKTSLTQLKTHSKSRRQSWPRISPSAVLC